MPLFFALIFIKNSNKISGTYNNQTIIKVKKPQLFCLQRVEVFICTGGETRTLTPCGTRS
jgi:hypothetical protein